MIWIKVFSVTSIDIIIKVQERVVSLVHATLRQRSSKQRGYVVWSQQTLPSELTRRFDEKCIPVVGIRHVRLWGIQIDDERELAGHERSTIPDEEIGLVNLKAKDGSHYELNADYVTAAPA